MESTDLITDPAPIVTGPNLPDIIPIYRGRKHKKHNVYKEPIPKRRYKNKIARFSRRINRS